MSVTITTDVFCDGTLCGGQWTGTTTGPRPDSRRARANARAIGWKYVDGRDLCPTCYQAEGGTGDRAPRRPDPYPPGSLAAEMEAAPTVELHDLVTHPGARS